MRAFIFALAAFTALAAPAGAEVTASDANGFLITHSAEIPLDRETAWARLVEIGRWWNDAHTYSGVAANMSLEPRAGGCFCETWENGAASVEHGRVVLAIPGHVLRLYAALGPLQETGAAGVLSAQFTETDGRLTAAMTYRVSGPESANLAALAPIVDQVLGEQFAGLLRYAGAVPAP